MRRIMEKVQTNKFFTNWAKTKLKFRIPSTKSQTDWHLNSSSIDQHVQKEHGIVHDGRAWATRGQDIEGDVELLLFYLSQRTNVCIQHTTTRRIIAQPMH